MTNPHYAGRELDTFAHAANWKRYWAKEVSPYLSGDVLEVGAGTGVNTDFLETPQMLSWTCLEPDPILASQMRERFSTRPRLTPYRAITGNIENLEDSDRFDSIIYADVLEHIEDDREEMARASGHLRAGGYLIVLAPAHQFLYTPFDQAVGHFRRYNRANLRRSIPADCRQVRLCYLDSVGLLASFGNRALLRQADPSLKQILLWDRVLVPASRLMDRITLHRLGKSILGIWKKM